MDSGELGLDEYQSRAIRTDRTRSSGGLDLAVLGLFGETGSLLSETKKKQRDARSYLGYEASVVEEMGDVLWYMAAVAGHADLRLSEIARRRVVAGTTPTFAALQPQHALPLEVPTAAFERTLLRLAGDVGRLAALAGRGELAADQSLPSLLETIFDALASAADEAGVTLEEAAVRNLAKVEDRWPTERLVPPLFDDAFPLEERLPRSLTVDIFERTGGNDRRYVVQRCNGIFIGDRLTDNIIKPDDYRFHDAFHYAYAAVLGWSPVTRALFRLKRKSEVRVDEGEDGARAILIEEGVATFVFGEAKRLDFFEGQRPGDLGFGFLRSVRQFARGYEVESRPLWLWEEAILAGNEAFRFLRQKRRGRLRLDLHSRRMSVEELPE